MSIPDVPADGAVVADLETLREYVGARTTADDENLQKRLDAALGYVYDRVYEDDRGHPQVQEAVLLMASRLYKRRQSPEGVAGFASESAVVQVVARDPDVAALLERHIDYKRVGIA